MRIKYSLQPRFLNGKLGLGGAQTLLFGLGGVPRKTQLAKRGGADVVILDLLDQFCMRSLQRRKL